MDGIVGLDGLIVQAYCLNGYSHHPPPQPPAKLSPKSVSMGNLMIRSIIGASLSEPHTSESNVGFFIYIYIIYYISAVRTYSINASSTLLT